MKPSRTRQFLGLAACLLVPLALLPATTAGSALQNGVNQFLRVDPPRAPDLRNRSFSIEFWARRATLGGEQDGIVATGPSRTRNNYLFIGFRPNNTLVFSFWENALNVPRPVTDLGWHHYACVYDANDRSRRVYLDGELVASDVATAHFQGYSYFYIGQALGEFGIGQRNFQGTVDELRVWTRVRTLEEIRRDWQRPLTGTEEGLDAYYTFDDAGEGTADWSGHNRGGTLYGNTRTSVEPPLVRELASTTLPTAVGPAGAVLNGLVGGNPDGVTTWFEWGRETTGLSLDGAGQYAELGAGDFWANGSALTIEAWVHPRSYANWSRVLDIGNGPSSDNVLLAMTSTTTGRPYYEVWRGNQRAGYLGAPTALPLNQWSHLAITHEGTSVRMYLNGLPVATAEFPQPLPVQRTRAYLGRSNWADALAHGLLDEVRIWNVGRTASQLRSTLFTPPGPDDRTGLVAEYTFDTAAGTVATDTSGNGHHATLVGYPPLAPASRPTFVQTTPETPAGAATRVCLDFDATDDVVTVPHQAAFNTLPLTASAWVRVDPGTRAGVINKYVSGSMNGWQMFLVGGELRAWYFRNNVHYVWDGGNGLNAGPVDDGAWHHVAFAVDATGGRLYVDGVLRDRRGWTGTPGAPVNATPLTLGAYDGLLGGQMRDASVWGVALDDAEILGLATTPLDPSHPRFDTLLGWWKLDEGTGNSAANSRPGGDPGAISGNAAWFTESPANATLAGLEPGSTCQARLVALRDGVAIPGPVQTFVTPATTAAGALAFDGVDDAVSIRGFSSLGALTEVTVEFWQLTRSVKAGASFATHPDNAGANRLLALVPWNNGRVYWDFGGVPAGRLDYLPPVSLLDRWHHFAFVAKAGAGGYLRIYRNGVLEAERYGTIPGFNPALADDFRIGQLQLPEGLYSLHGDLDEFRLWTQARNGADIARDYNRRLAGDEPSLAILHRLDEAAGPVVRNSADAPLAGVLRNGARRLASTAPVESALPLEGLQAQDLATGWPRLTGQVKPGGANPRAWFEYGSTLSIDPTNSLNLARFWTLPQNVEVNDLDAINFAAPPTVTAPFENIARTPGSGNFQPGVANDRFAASFRGRLLVPQTGNWTFTLVSDDGSRLLLDGVMVLDHDGLHGSTEKSVTLSALPAGLHDLEVRMFENLGSAALVLYWSGPGTPFQPIPADAFRTVPILDHRTPVAALEGVEAVPVGAVAADVAPGVYTYFRLVAADDQGTNVTATTGFAVAHPAAGLAASFDGRDDYAQINLNPAETDATHEFWFRTTHPSAGLFSVHVGSSHDRHIYLLEGNINARLWSTVASQSEIIRSTGLNLADGEWHHVAHSFGTAVDGQILVVDGQLVASGKRKNSDFVAASGIHLGFSVDAASPFLPGEIDEVRIWSRALTAAEIATLYDRSLKGTEPGLVAWYRFDTITGSVSPSAVGSNNGASLFNGTGLALSGAKLFKPAATTLPAAPVLATSATLNGLVNASGQANTVAFFEWGTAATFPVRTASLPMGGGITNTPVSITLTGLEPGTTYRYRLIAQGTAGETEGEIRSFDTLLLGCGWPLASKVSNGGATAPRQAIDADGNVILGGTFSGIVTFKSSIGTVGAAENPFIAKANKKGDWLWQAGIPVTGTARINGLATDPLGHVIVAGEFTGEATFGTVKLTATSTHPHLFVASMAADGSGWRWARTASSGNDHTAATVAVDAQGAVFIAGTFAGTLGLDAPPLTAAGARDAFVARLAPDGSAWTWRTQAGGTGATLAANALVADRGVLYLAGHFSHGANQSARFATVPDTTSLVSAGNTDLFFAKLAAADGRWLFARRGGGADADTASALALDASGAPFLAGRFHGSGNADFDATPLRAAVGSDSAFIASFATNGVLRAVAGAAPVDIAALAVTADDRIWVTGDFTLGPSFGRLPGLTSRGTSDVFLALLDAGNLADEDWLWATAIGGLGTETRGGLGLDPHGDVFFSGTYQAEVRFGFVALAASNPTSDVFLAKLNTSRLKYEHNTYLVGAPVEIPAEAIDPDAGGGAYGQPTIEILEKEHTDSDQFNSFVWSIAEKRLHAIRPVTARFRWPLSASPPATGGSVVMCVGRTAWPEVDNPRVPPPTDNQKRARLHIAGTPANLAPKVDGFPMHFQGLNFTEINGAAVDGTTHQFNAPAPGWSVLQFLRSGTATPDPTRHASVFEVVRTEVFDDPRYLATESARVGSTLRRAAHSDPEKLQGWVVNETAFYDGAGEDRAHDRPTRTGPIIPVNIDRVGAADDLVVVWYRVSPDTGTAWPQDPVRYTTAWPADATPIIIASGRGFPLTPENQTAARVYNQPDPRLPGFNPNEEHAFKEGTRIFALRDDLHAIVDASEPFVLLKYRDRASGEWTMTPLRVVAEGTGLGETFQRDAIAGERLNLIEPLGLPVAFTLVNYCDPDPHWLKDYEGRLYARGAGPGSAAATITGRFFYQMQEGFFLDLNKDGVPDALPGTPLPLLDRRPGGQTGVPTPIVYNISWPTDAPNLQIGATLFGSRAGLPDVNAWSSATLVFDQSDPEGTNALSGLARLFDPLSDRSLQVRRPGATNYLTGPGYEVFFAPDDYDPMDGLATVRTPDGKFQLARLPFSIRIRLLWDEGQRNLVWRGWLDESQDYGGRENPLLLINVLSQRERDAIQAEDNVPDSLFDQMVTRLYELTRNPNRLDLDGTGGPDLDLLVGLRLGPVTNIVNGIPVVTTRVLPETFSDQRKALTGSFGPGNSGYITLAENNDPRLNGTQPIQLRVLEIAGGPALGDIKVIRSDNVFDEKLVLRHSGDFRGEPERFEFEWYYQPDTGPTIATNLPVETPDGLDLRGWRRLQAGFGVNDVVLGDPALGADPLLVLSDNWILCRYRGFVLGGETNWSGWVGLIGGDRAQFAPGWIKRVLDGLNPFTARSTNFHSAPASTYASMLRQAGRRYEGDIAFNGSAENLERLGLIEAYETVLRRGRRLSIDAAPPVDDPPANNALLLAAGNIADLYMLLGNEAYADASDPTIGFRSDAAGYGTLAPSIFTFQNQLDSLLEEELALLRGRDDTAQSVRVPPAYHRLLWNFTRGEGEVAYAQSYNLTDQDLNGVIDTTDARIMFPQGHGDAWGHYLTALTTYYGLLRNESYTWIPRAETVNLGGNTVTVDYLDERKFATAAAARARTGAEITDLTYRLHYVDDPAGQWQGYKDPNPARAWGVTEWARRTGVGAWYDWVVGNALLPTEDPDPTHTGIARIDRQTVPGLNEIVAAHAAVQGQLDKADAGLNPLGLAKNSVPFDVDPAEISAGKTHFEQIYERALAAVANTLTVFNHASQLTQSLRSLQDEVNQFSRAVDDQERDFKNRLIEQFGHPYGGDIGPGRTYPSGYDGPDLYHWMYVPVSDLTGETAGPSASFTGFFTRLDPLVGAGSHYFGDDFHNTLNENLVTDGILSVQYPVLPRSQYPTTAPASWGSRRAPGEIQLALSDMLQARARLERSLLNYDLLIQRIDDAIDSLEAREQLGADITSLENTRTAITVPLKAVAFAASQVKDKLKGIMDSVKETTEAVVEGVPKVVGLATDAFSSVRAAVVSGRIVSTTAIKVGYFAASAVEEGSKASIEKVTELYNSRITGARSDYETAQLLRQIETLVREEATLRAEAETLAESLRQQTGRYQAAIERGYRLLEERADFRRNVKGDTQARRYQDMTFRVFRNDALQKYRAQFDLAARYTFLAAIAYDFETQLLGGTSGAGREFLTDIVRQRSLGQIENGRPIAGRHGLADPLARLSQNFGVLKGQLGFNNPQTETGRFSLRRELFRIPNDPAAAPDWRATLRRHVIADLWDLPEFRRFCRPFAPENAGPQPGLVIRFPSTVTFGLNFFGWPLGGGDSAYDPTLFSTKVRSVGVWFSNYDGHGLALTPRVYLVPAGADILRSPTGNDLATRVWRVVDQRLPVPFPIGVSSLGDPDWIPAIDSLSGVLEEIRRFSSFRAYHDSGAFSAAETIQDSRLIGRSVWNTDWVLIIPGGTFLNDPDRGLEAFINSVSDIKVFFQTYSYSGN